MMKSRSDMIDAVKATIPLGGVVVPVGSRVTCDPPPMDTDEDFLILVDDMHKAVVSLMEMGFETETDPQKIEDYNSMMIESGGRFTSLRFGDVNYIVTDDVFFFERFLTGSYVAKKLNLMNKEDRVLVHSAVRGAVFAHRMEPKMLLGNEHFCVRRRKIGEVWQEFVYSQPVINNLDQNVSRNFHRMRERVSEEWGDVPF